jgi:hypothetical protein
MYLLAEIPCTVGISGLGPFSAYDQYANLTTALRNMDCMLRVRDMGPRNIVAQGLMVYVG